METIIVLKQMLGGTSLSYRPGGTSLSPAGTDVIWLRILPDWSQEGKYLGSAQRPSDISFGGYTRKSSAGG